MSDAIAIDAGLIAQAAEIDDPLHPCVLRRTCEGRGRIGVLALEVGGIERVHEVVGGVAVGERTGQARRVVDVAHHRCTCSVVGVRVAGHRLDVMAGLDERGTEARAHESGGAGYEDVHRESITGRGRR
jgi:hypothetical protein